MSRIHKKVFWAVFIIFTSLLFYLEIYRPMTSGEPAKPVRYYVTDMTLGESRIITYEATERPEIDNGVVTFTRKDSSGFNDIITLGPSQRWSTYEMVER